VPSGGVGAGVVLVGGGSGAWGRTCACAASGTSFGVRETAARTLDSLADRFLGSGVASDRWPGGGGSLTAGGAERRVLGLGTGIECRDAGPAAALVLPFWRTGPPIRKLTGRGGGGGGSSST